MTQLVLVFLAVAGAISAFFGFHGLIEVALRREATVFQQISARVDVGLSLLVFATSAGLAAVINQQGRTVRELQRLRTLTEKLGSVPPMSSDPVSATPALVDDAPDAEGRRAARSKAELIKTLVAIGALLLIVAVLYVTKDAGI